MIYLKHRGYRIMRIDEAGAVWSDSGASQGVRSIPSSIVKFDSQAGGRYWWAHEDIFSSKPGPRQKAASRNCQGTCSSVSEARAKIDVRIDSGLDIPAVETDSAAAGKGEG